MKSVSDWFQTDLNVTYVFSKASVPADVVFPVETEAALDPHEEQVKSKKNENSEADKNRPGIFECNNPPNINTPGAGRIRIIGRSGAP